MDNIIQDFAENFIKDIEKYILELFEGEKEGISELIGIMQQDMEKLGREPLANVFERIDEEIRESKERKKSWDIQARFY